MCGTISYIKMNVLQDFHVCMSVPLKLFLQNVGFVFHKLPITHGKGPHPGPTINIEFDFNGIDFEITLSSKV